TLQEVAVYFFDPEDFVSQRVRVFLGELRERYPSLRLVEGDMGDERVREIKEMLDNLFGVPEEEKKQLPCLFMGGRVLMGEKEIVAWAEKLLLRNKP
ncbi:MAG: hypothetical protein ACPL7L_05195, partial [bacterium]